jgi:drug/metabolite transporter (DMT)-like permease
MPWLPGARQTGVFAALTAALLFGAGTPLAKGLLTSVNPWLLAGLLYLGAGLGLAAYRLMRRAPRVRLAIGEWPWLAGAIAAGGVLGPVLLMFGLTGMPASGHLYYSMPKPSSLPCWPGSPSVRT